MDPLSVTNSIAGLGKAAAELEKVIREHVEGTSKNVPDILLQLLQNIQATGHVLSRLGSTVKKLDVVKPSQLQTHQIVAVLTDGVIIFSELETAAQDIECPPLADVKLPLKAHPDWPGKEKRLELLQKRLAAFEQSTSMILAILRSDSHFEGAQHRIQLTTNVDSLMDENFDVMRRILAADNSFDIENLRTKKGYLSSRKPDHENWPLPASPITPSRLDSVADLGAVLPGLDDQSRSGFMSPISTSSFNFEADLAYSGPYRRANRESMDFSMRSSFRRPWSSLSDSSQGQASAISVIALPLFADDITNPQHYNFSSPPSYPPPPYSPFATEGEGSRAGSALPTVVEQVDEPPATPVPSVASPTREQILSSGLEILHRMYCHGTSIFHNCLAIKSQLYQLLGFTEAISSYAFEWRTTNPMEELVSIFREGWPLFWLFNKLDSRFKVVAPKPGGVPYTVPMFFKLCKEFGFDIYEFFTLDDLMGDDYLGYLRFLSGIELVLSQLMSRGLVRPVVRREFNLPEITEMTPLQAHLETFVIQQRRYFLDLGDLLEIKDVLQEAEPLSHKLLTAFETLKIIIHFEARFLLDIEAQITKPRQSQEWGTPFLTWSEGSDTYAEFISLEDDNARELRQRSHRLDSSEQQSERSAVMKCVRRIMTLHDQLRKYQDFFREFDLLSNEEFQPWQVENIANGKAAVKNVLEKAYEATEKADMRDALADLNSRMEDWRGYRIANFGELIAHDSLRGRSDNRAKDTTKTYKVYLFEKIFLCVREVDGPAGKRVLALRGRIWARDIKKIDSSTDGPLAFRIHWSGDEGTDILTLRFRSRGQKESWCSKILRVQEMSPNIRKAKISS
ncbi:unnamed protein product [Clonostachys byssicola]|uniref:Cdc24/Scd1 N-terminal domain-containing protein n=1 Tax=Clonostachys byssicola TaxID=160290 RepID=A0A9N9Y2I4_9HYPO|nr:unnamed protein product [Clonostachys byssicola]